MKTKKTFLKLLLLFLITVFNGFSRTIVLNINNGQTNGNLFQLNENVVIGDVIRFTNNLPYTITNVSGMQGMMTSVSNNNGFNQNITIPVNGFFEVVLANTNATQFTFIHFNMGQGIAYNSRINLVFALTNYEFLNSQDYKFTNLNPTNDVVECSFNNEQAKIKLSVYNLVGEIIKTFELENVKTITTPVSDLKAGLYFFHYNSLNKKIIYKVLVN